jgi:hypothetical protein
MEKRIPLTGVYNTRPGTGALSGSSAISGIGVSGVMICGNGAVGSAKDHRMINRLQITEKDQYSGVRLYVPKRPGFAALNTPRTGHVGNAIRVWAGQGTGTKVMTCFGNTNFKLYDGTTDKGDGTGKATGITETSISGTATLFISSDDSKGWTYQDGGSMSNINDADFPGNASRTLAGTFAHMDGYPFIMDTTGRVYNGDLNSASAWTANSYITANSVPDVGMGVVRNRNLLIGFCKGHYDVFRNAGNAAGSPLSRVEELSRNIGCIGNDAVTVVRDTVYWIGTTKGANLALYSFDNGAVQKLSTSEQEAAFAIAGVSAISITKVGFYGRHFIIVCASSSTFAYCVEENNWHEWNGVQLWFKSDGVASSSSVLNYSISRNSTSGKVYVLNPASVVYQDDGVSYTALVQTPIWDNGTKRRKFVADVTVIGDQEEASATLYVSYSDDDYQTFSMPRSVDMSAERPFVSRLGSPRKRAYRLSDSANAAMRLEAIETNFTEGS